MRECGLLSTVHRAGLRAHAILLAWLFAGSIPSTGSAQCLIISEYVEGTANNKALEIRNLSPAAIDLAARGGRILIYANGAASATATVDLTGVIPPGSVHVVAHAGAGAQLAPLADELHSSLAFNGDDAIELVLDGLTMDVIGQIGVDPGVAWGTLPVTTMDLTLRRKETVTRGDVVGSDPFDPVTEWDAYPLDTFHDLGLPPGGVFFCSPLSVSDQPEDGEAWLSPPYPNPHPGGRVATIGYSLGMGGLVRLEVLDVTGRRVALLVDAERPAGKYLANWDGRDDAGHVRESGVYFVRLQAGGRSFFRKLARLAR